MPDTEQCDRCNSTILLDEFGSARPAMYSIAVPVDDADVYENEARQLCSACEADFLEWIDEGDIDRSDCVDLPNDIESGEMLRRAANTLDKLADVMEEELE